MDTRNGKDYTQNYDLIVKWIAAALRGETLEVLGVKTGRIEEVFGFEPADITVRSGRVDVMIRDEAGALFHLEEQRNLRRADLFRFAAYHFFAAQQWGTHITDIILASGDVSVSNPEIATNSGAYNPTLIDFSGRNGKERLTEIREAIVREEFENWIELVFLPLYGKETGPERSAFVEEVLRFESELYHTEKISARLLAAALILSNKLVEKEVLHDLWEEIKMLDILEIAREKGMEEGKTLASQDMVVDTLLERFNVVASGILEGIRNIRNLDMLRGIHRQAIKCKDLDEFEAILRQIST